MKRKILKIINCIFLGLAIFGVTTSLGGMLVSCNAKPVNEQVAKTEVIINEAFLDTEANYKESFYYLRENKAPDYKILFDIGVYNDETCYYDYRLPRFKELPWLLKKTNLKDVIDNYEVKGLYRNFYGGEYGYFFPELVEVSEIEWFKK